MTNAWHEHNAHYVMPKFSHWSREHCNKIKSDIEECRRQIQNVRNNSTRYNQEEVVRLRKKMRRLLSQENAYWRQRAKTHWYRDGDRNTKFFHASATTRKKVNQILSLEDNAGNKVSNSAGMCEIEKNYFLDLFQKNNNHAAPVIEVILQSASDEDNVTLTTPFTKEEFNEAMFSMHPINVPGRMVIVRDFINNFGTCVVMRFSKNVVFG